MPAEPTFSYSTAPLPVKPTGRRKYRDDEAHLTLMSDPRVIRGSIASALRKGNTSMNSQVVDKGKTRAPGSRKINSGGDDGGEVPPLIQPTFYFDVEPVVDPNIDLTRYLEEDQSTIKPKAKLAETQTDIFNERPDTPEYVPRKTGIDRSTQVDNLADLFIFDEEVEPMLNVIVSKTLEQALVELEHEVELENLAAECERYGQEKQREMEWIRKREQESIADAVVKDLALKGMKEKQYAENEVRAKVASRRATLQLLATMVTDIDKSLRNEKVWKDPLVVHVSEVLLPDLYRSAAARARLHDDVTDVLDGEWWVGSGGRILYVCQLHMYTVIYIYIYVCVCVCQVMLTEKYHATLQISY